MFHQQKGEDIYGAAARAADQHHGRQDP
jgi:hypothetical protein